MLKIYDFSNQVMSFFLCFSILIELIQRKLLSAVMTPTYVIFIIFSGASTIRISINYKNSNSVLNSTFSSK